MYHLDGNPSSTDQTLLKDLIKFTTAKWQTVLKGQDIQRQEDGKIRPSVSRSSTKDTMTKRQAGAS
jgi:hypothetical protein